MKTKSIKSVAALLGVGVALNLSVLAGPGPESEPRIQMGSSGKAVIAEQVRNTSSAAKSVKKQSPKLVRITGPRWSTFGYVR